MIHPYQVQDSHFLAIRSVPRDFGSIIAM
jgi:hypothetical protein